MTTTTQSTGVHENTYIYVSKFRVYIRVFLGVLLLAGAIYLYFNSVINSNIDLGKAKNALYVAPIIALFLLYQAFTALQKKGPQLTLSDKGITIAEKELMLWEDVSEIMITWNASKTLSFNHHNKKINVNFETYAVKPFVLKELVDTYRSKHLQNAQRNVISE